MPSVLIVEDNPLNFELAHDVLTAQGWEVEGAGDAVEARACLARHLPDLVLMDVQLPGMDGLAPTQALRADPPTRDLVIVAMTAHALVGDALRVAAAGCDGYLTKPIQTRTLSHQLAAFLPGPTGARAAPGRPSDPPATIAEPPRTVQA